MAGTYILTDTINHAFAEVFGTAYKNKAVVVTAKERSASERLADATDQRSDARPRARGPGVAAASGDVFTRATLLTTTASESRAPPLDRRCRAAGPLRGLHRDKGHLPRTADEVAIDQATAQRDHLRLGQQLVIAGSAPARSYTISGIAKFAGSESFGGTSVALLLPARRSTWRANRANTTASTSPRAPASPPNELASRVRTALPATLIVRTGAQEAANQTSELEEKLGFLRTFLLIFAYVALVVGRSSSSTPSRSPSPSACASSACCARSAPRAGRSCAPSSRKGCCSASWIAGRAVRRDRPCARARWAVQGLRRRPARQRHGA